MLFLPMMKSFRKEAESYAKHRGSVFRRKCRWPKMKAIAGNCCLSRSAILRLMRSSPASYFAWCVFMQKTGFWAISEDEA